MKRKALAVLLSSAMMLSLAACGQSETTSSSASTESTAASSEVESESEEAGEELPVASDEILYLGDGDGEVDFDLWMAIHTTTSSFYNSLNEHPGAALWEEATGVTVNWINPPVGEETTNLNLMLNDLDSLPDVFQIGNFDSIYPGGATMAIEDGVILDITELVEEYAPNFMAMINANESLKKDVYNDDGYLTGFGTVIINEEKSGNSMRGPIINTEYLEEAGLDLPVTIDDWTEMLTAFRDMGVKYPLIYEEAYLKDCFSGAYGVTQWADYYVDVEGDGTVKFGPAQDGYKEYLELMNMWYEEGLLSADFATDTLTGEVRTAMASGDAGVIIDYVTQFKQLPVNADSYDYDLELVGAQYPVLEEGDTAHLRDYEGTRTALAMYITCNAEDPIEIIQWIDQMYSEDGRYLNTFGEEGVTYEYVDGVLQYTDLITANPDGLSETEAGRALIFKDMFRTWENEDHLLIYTEDSQYDAWDEWNKADIESELPSMMTMTADESDDYVKIAATLDTYVAEMRLKFIMGTESFDNWDTYIATLESLEYKDSEAIKQAAYDRYEAR
ncbi:MAG: extracellular solute-binding protein [Lachnospiraceae bacterium]